MSERFNDIPITFNCPFCGQGNETTLRKALTVTVDPKYIGSGDYVADVTEVGLNCTGCKKTAVCPGLD